MGSKHPNLPPSAPLSFLFSLLWLPPQQPLPVRAWLTPRQLEKYQDVLEKLLAELLQDTPDGTVRGLISALGILPFLLLTSSSARRYLYSPGGFLCRVCSLCGALRSQPLPCAPFWEGYSLVRCCLCPRADSDWQQQHNPSQQICLPLPCSSSSSSSQKVLGLQGTISSRAGNSSCTFEAAQHVQSQLGTPRCLHGGLTLTLNYTPICCKSSFSFGKSCGGIAAANIQGQAVVQLFLPAG